MRSGTWPPGVWGRRGLGGERLPAGLRRRGWVVPPERKPVGGPWQVLSWLKRVGGPWQVPPWLKSVGVLLQVPSWWVPVGER